MSVYTYIGPEEGTGTQPDYLVNCLTKKLKCHSTQKSRNSSRVSGGGVGAEGMVTKGANWRGPGTKYKRSNNVFAVTSIALSLGRLGSDCCNLPRSL